MGTQKQSDKISKLLKDLHKDPENVFVMKYLAEEYLSHGEYQAAINYFEKILLKNPEDTDVIVHLATAYVDALNVEKAIYRATQITEKEGLDNALYCRAYDALARAARLKGDEEQAGMHEVMREEYAEKTETPLSLVEGEKIDPLPDAEEQVLLFNRQDKDKKISLIDGYSEKAVDFVPFEKSDMNFSHVGGLEPLKEDIRLKIIYPFNKPEVYKAYGKQMGGGILLYGPPGCGKTYISKATAGECRANFISVGISDILDMWHGNTEKNISRIFETARGNAPAIIFFDEVEAIGGSRTSMREHYQRVVVNQLLSEMDGIKSTDDKVLVLGATNAPWFVDSALRRPGRFDRVVFVSSPDLKGRIAILNIYLKDRPVRNVDVYKIAEMTEGFSGADLRNLVDTTMETGIRKTMETGQVQELSTQDFIKALKMVKETTSEWFETAKNYATYSNESGLYDPVVAYLESVNKTPHLLKHLTH